MYALLPALRASSLAAPALPLLLLAHTGAAQGELDAPLRFLAGTERDFHAITDLDGDGDEDLLALQRADFTATGFVPYLATGGPDLLAPGATVDLSPVSDYPAEAFLLAADVTGDAVAEVLVSSRDFSHSGFGFLLYPGLGGAAYGAPLFHPLQSFPRAGDLGDRDADGFLELVEVHYTGGAGDALSWWSFAAHQTSQSAVLALPGHHDSAAALDLNADGLCDAVAGNSDGNSVALVLTGPSLDPVAGGSIAVGALEGVAPQRTVRAADVDADGDDDVVVAWPVYGAGADTAYLATIEITASGPVAHGPVSFGWTPGSYWQGESHAADWDGDGALDVLCAWSELFFWRGDGQHGFELQAIVPLGTGSIGGSFEFGSTGAGALDLDLDGELDYAGGDVLYLGDGRFHDGSWSTGAGQDQSIVPFDLEGDGDEDLAGVWGDTWSNDGTGGFTHLADQWPPNPAPFSYVNGHGTGDYDSDGRLDWIAEYRQLIPDPFPFGTSVFVEDRLLRGTPLGGVVDAGAAGPPGVMLGNTTSGEVLAADVNGDGDGDAWASSGWYENDGAGYFAVHHADFQGQGRAAADFSGDGFTDVLSYHQQSGAGLFTWYASLKLVGMPGFAAQTLAQLPFAGSSPRSARVRDLDDDGDLDVAIGTDLGAGGPRVMLFENDGAGGLPMGQTLLLPAGQKVHEALLVDDLDGDGLTDLAASATSVQAPAGGDVFVWKRIGPGLSYSAPLVYFAYTSSQEMDADGDGDRDQVGERSLRGARKHGATGGIVRQYGTGDPGSSYVRPLLGAKGPMHAGGIGAELRLRRGLGAAPGLILAGGGEGFVPDVLGFGGTLWIDPLNAVIPIVLGGAAGVPAAGELDVPLGLGPGYAGKTFFLEIVLLDSGAPFGPLVGSNGLELYVGI